jgi:prepilin-type N-terminal cleavage/methylation domain-containing protein
MLQFKLFLNNKKGLSLIEIIISVALMSLILLMIAPVLFLEKTNKSIGYLVLANQIASRKMEELKQLPFANLPANGTTTISDPDILNLPNGEGFIFAEDYESTNSLKHITVLINWKSGESTSTYKLDALFYNK